MPDRNGIAARQNETQSLKFQWAARFFYQWVQRIRALELVFVVLFPTLLSIAATVFENVALAAAVYGFALTVIDAAVFYPLQNAYRRKGAQSQELFDSYVLEMPTSRARLSGAPDLEDIEGIATRAPQNAFDTLRDWYSPRVASLPLELARLVCQRTNCTWDAGLRSFYIGVLLTVAIVVAVILLIVMSIMGWSFPKFVLAILFPITPALVWAIREYLDQADARSAKTDLRGIICDLWERRLDGSISDAATAAGSIDVQAGLFAFRGSSPPIPNQIYKWCRNRFQTQMHEGAGVLVDEAVSRFKGPQ